MLKSYTDQTGYSVGLHFKPKRIVSLVPSQTELLAHLGLGDEVVGITKFCIHPEDWFRNKTRVGGTKQLNIDKIIELDPDIIFANKEENTKEDIISLRKHFRVWTSDIFNLEDNLSMVASIGEMTGKREEAQSLIDSTKTSFSNLGYSNKKKALYLIWQNPYMAAGPESYIHDMLGYVGFANVLSMDSHDLRYPEMTNDEIARLEPEFILLSSEPFPFKEQHQKELQQQFPKSKILLVDGEMFSWYGSRPLLAAKYFKSLHLQITQNT